MQEKICVFTHHPNDDKQLKAFRKSFDAHHGWGVCVLGVDTDRSMMQCYMDALRITDKDRIVVCIDTRDTTCNRDSTDLMKNFLSYNTPILISGCKKKDGLCVVGYAGDLYNMFGWSVEHGKDITQFPGKACLDMENKILNTHVGTSPCFVYKPGYNIPRLVIISASIVVVVCSIVKIDFLKIFRNKK